MTMLVLVSLFATDLATGMSGRPVGGTWPPTGGLSWGACVSRFKYSLAGHLNKRRMTYVKPFDPAGSAERAYGEGTENKAKAAVTLTAHLFNPYLNIGHLYADHKCRRSMSNSNIMARSHETFLLSVLRPATISIVRRNRTNRKFSASGQNASYRAARIEPAD